MFFPPHPGTAKSVLPGKNSSHAPKASLANRGHLDLFGAGLTGQPGAEEVIDKIQSRRTVTKLSLGHNDLGDEGCVHLFAFLRTPAGSLRDRITELKLISNSIGEAGLLAVCAWLDGNQTVRELYLPHNCFYLSPTSIITLAEAVNSSGLHTLSLSTNPTLGDAFLSTFLPALCAPHLRELQLSDIGLSPRSAQPLADFISDWRHAGKLHVLKLNANSLGYRGVAHVMRAAQRNWALTRLELAANHLADEDEETAGSGSDAEDAGPGAAGPRDWRVFEADVQRLVIRNTQARRAVESDALRLLHYARAALLPRAAPAPPPRLPPELVLHVLRFLAPALSTAQRARVCAYAQDRATLPAVGARALRLPGTPAPAPAPDACLPDPARLAFSVGGGLPATPSSSMSPAPAKPPLWALTPAPGTTLAPTAAAHRCANGCMGVGNSLRCWREELRVQWLEQVGCDAYEPED